MEDDRSWCIYLHTNIVNNKKYIGLTCHIENRFGINGSGYLRKNKEGKYVQPLFANAILKYGWNNFKTEIIKDNLTKEEADKWEEYYINLYDTRNNKKGYNIRQGGSHGKLSEKTKEKLRETMLGRYDGEKNPFYGKQHTQDTKNIISKKNKENMKNRDVSGENNPMYGKKMSEEVKQKISKSMKGKERTQETKDRLSKSLKEFYQTHEHHTKGTHKTDETKEKISKALKGKIFSEQHKENIGKSHSPFTYVCVETGKEYYSSGEAMRDTGIDKASIRRAANGQQKIAGGLHWVKKDK